MITALLLLIHTNSSNQIDDRLRQKKIDDRQKVMFGFSLGWTGHFCDLDNACPDQKKDEYIVK